MGTGAAILISGLISALATGVAGGVSASKTAEAGRKAEKMYGEQWEEQKRQNKEAEKLARENLAMQREGIGAQKQLTAYQIRQQKKQDKEGRMKAISDNLIQNLNNNSNYKNFIRSLTRR